MIPGIEWTRVTRAGDLSFAPRHPSGDRDASAARVGGETDPLSKECPRWESNPHGPYGPTDFKSVASAVPPRGLGGLMLAGIGAGSNWEDGNLNKRLLSSRGTPTDPAKSKGPLRSRLNPSESLRMTISSRITIDDVPSRGITLRPPAVSSAISRGFRAGSF